MAIAPAGGIQGAGTTNAPAAQDMNQFKAGLTLKSDQELMGMLGNKNLTKEQTSAVIDEILSRKPRTEESHDSGGGLGLEDLLELLRKGKISPEQLEQLKAMLAEKGFSAEQIDSLLSKFGKGSEGSGETAPTDSADIK